MRSFLIFFATILFQVPSFATNFDKLPLLFEGKGRIAEDPRSECVVKLMGDLTGQALSFEVTKSSKIMTFHNVINGTQGGFGKVQVKSIRPLNAFGSIEKKGRYDSGTLNTIEIVAGIHAIYQYTVTDIYHQEEVERVKCVFSSVKNNIR